MTIPARARACGSQNGRAAVQAHTDKLLTNCCLGADKRHCAGCWPASPPASAGTTRKSTLTTSTATLNTRAASLLTAPSASQRGAGGGGGRYSFLHLPSFRRSHLAEDGGAAGDGLTTAATQTLTLRDSGSRTGSAGEGPPSPDAYSSTLSTLATDVAWRDCLLDPAKIQARPRNAMPAVTFGVCCWSV
jgi:hypothetical protein